MSYILHYLRKILFIAGIAAVVLSFSATNAVAQAQQSAGSGLSSEATDQVEIADDGRQVMIESGVFDGDLTVSGSNVNIVVSGGTHIINGNVQINGKDDRVIIGFDEKEGLGQMNINGTLTFGPDNTPTLGLDLSKVNLSSGASFPIIEATEIVGEFNGLSSGSIFRTGGYTLRIVYSSTSISLIVVSVVNDRLPSFTPIIEIDTDLIDPTSTAPTAW